VDQQIGLGDANASRAESQWKIYRDLFAPVEARMVKDANEYDSTERKERMAAEAAADIARGYQGALESSQRAMQRLGVNPNSGRFQALSSDIGLGLARDTAGAMNKARRDTELQGMAMRESAAKFGRNMPTMGIASDAAALNAGNSAAGNMTSGAALHNAGLNAAQDWFGGAASANTAGGNLALGQYNAQLDAWAREQQANETRCPPRDWAAWLGNWEAPTSAGRNNGSENDRRKKECPCLIQRFRQRRMATGQALFKQGSRC
jgi:hypothetical protein